MRWSFEVGQIKGIKIKIHLTFLFILLWGAFNYGGRGGALGLLYGAAVTLLIFGIVLLHELGHSLAAIWLGIRVQDITLLPIGGVARLERMPRDPLHELLVSAAGPAVNAVLAVLAAPVLWVMADGQWSGLFSLRLLQPGPASIFVMLFLINLSLLVFNLIPAFPLDGGRIFRSILAIWLGLPRATRVAVVIGQIFAFLLGVYGIFTRSWVTVAVSLFVFSAGGAEGRAAAILGVLDRIKVRQVMRYSHTVLLPHLTATEVASMVLRVPQANFPVMADDALVGVISRKEVHRAIERGEQWVRIEQLMHTDFPGLDMDTTLADAQDSLLQGDSPAAAVFEGPRFMGLIGFEDIERAFHMFRARRVFA